MTSPATPALKTLAPGATIGMLGGGQLGRMTALAAARLGYRLHLFAPEGRNSPCGQVAAEVTQGSWNDADALKSFAAAVDVVTLEWENVPTETVSILAQSVTVHPGAHVLTVAQDRLAEKQFAVAQGLGTAPFRPVTDLRSLAEAVTELGTPCILKSNRFGYDGRGQIRINAGDDLSSAWNGLQAPVGILEGFVPFALEASVIVARRADGLMVCYPAVENQHQGGILNTTLVPGRLDLATAEAADRAARILTEALGVVGLLAVELFVLPNGLVLVNEVAPRPHNSGHWTMDFAETDQFEQLVRAVCGLPLGSPAIRQPCQMHNLIGDDVAEWPKILAEPGVRLHLYGKGEPRPLRKMGHVNRPWSG
jgi:5-(carboxyamino)imidazole ribonucleotide synthase